MQKHWENLGVFDHRYKVDGLYVAQLTRNVLAKDKRWHILWGKWDEPKRKQYVSSKEMGQALVESMYGTIGEANNDILRT